MSQATALRKANILRESLLDHGVPQVNIMLVPGRPASDRWDAIRAIGAMSHHVASKPTPAKPTPGLALVRNGRSDLAGPLANGHAGVNLIYNVITFGLANHPGTGGPVTLRGPLGNFTVPRNNARAYLWGTEYEGGYSDEVWDARYTNSATKKSMTFREFMGRANNGLIQGLHEIRGSSVGDSVDLSGYHLEHSSWTSRKIDRRGYTLASGRAEMRRYEIKSTPAKPATVRVYPTFRRMMVRETELIGILNTWKLTPERREEFTRELAGVYQIVYGYPREQWMALRREYDAEIAVAAREGMRKTADGFTNMKRRLDLLYRRYPA